MRWYNAEAQYAHDLSLECRRLGHRVVFFTQSGSPVADKARKSGFDPFEESGFNAKGLAAANVFPALLRFLRLLDREKFDAVEIHRSEDCSLIPGVCRLRG
ncbi:MAG: glycosyltransferase, partial [Deltaproteobacteria bacterium]|nr:glycosyltransferase [Deltaproteobacteria bacterium]